MAANTREKLALRIGWLIVRTAPTALRFAGTDDRRAVAEMARDEVLRLWGATEAPEETSGTTATADVVTPPKPKRGRR